MGVEIKQRMAPNLSIALKFDDDSEDEDATQEVLDRGYQFIPSPGIGDESTVTLELHATGSISVYVFRESLTHACRFTLPSGGLRRFKSRRNRGYELRRSVS